MEKVIISKEYRNQETNYLIRYLIIKLLYYIEYKGNECVTFRKLQ